MGGWDRPKKRRKGLAELRDALDKDDTMVNRCFYRWGNRCTLLNDAVALPDIDVVNILLDHGADPNILCGDDNNLHNSFFTASVTRGNRTEAMVLTLIKHGLEINAMMPETVNDRGYPNSNSTALHYVCSDGNYKFARILLDHGADVFAVDSEGMTPLSKAVTPAQNSRRNDEVLITVRTLVAYGADLHAIDIRGQTLLHRVAKYPCSTPYNMELVRYLVYMGVPDILDFKGMSACDVAKKEFGFNPGVLQQSRLFCTRFQTILDEHKQHLVAFALGNHQRGPRAHSKRREGGVVARTEWQKMRGKRPLVDED